MVRRQDIIAIVLILVLGFCFVAGTTISIKKNGEKHTTQTVETTISPKEKLEAILSTYEEEIVMMSKVLYREARGVTDKAQIAAVGWCILNRVDHPNHPDTIAEVITEPEQFAWEYNTPIEPELYYLSRDIMARWILEKYGKENVGRTLPKGWCFFVGDGEYNYFREEFESKEIWDWSYPSPY
jgi:hypothetical protein